MTWLNHALRGLLRKARDANGQKLVDVSTGMIDGVPISCLLPGTVPATRAVSGDFKLGVVGVRADIAYKALDQAVLSDDTGKVIYSFLQQDMVALRVTGRDAYATAVPATRAGAATPFPFSVLQNATP